MGSLSALAEEGELPCCFLHPDLAHALGVPGLMSALWLLEIGLSPTLYVFSLYLPALAHGQAAFQSAMDRFHNNPRADFPRS